MQHSKRWQELDAFMLLTAALLIGFGVVAIWSARGGGELSVLNEGVRQALFAAVGAVLLVLVASFNYRFLGTLAWFLYAASIATLFLVLVPGVGVAIGGSQRWFEFGPLTIQPSEFAKLATIIALAAFISSRGEDMREFGNFVASLMIAGLPAGLVFLQPDLGTATVFGVIWFAIIIVSQVRWRHLLGLFAIAVPVAAGAWQYLLQPYQRTRLLISFDPFSDAMGEGYNIIQARYAIGSGGLFGAGLQGGTQSRLELLKVRESDFIFAHASGMFGFVGMIALFALYIVLLWRCLRVAETARDTFGQSIAIAFSAVLFYQAFINVGMNLGLLPVTGITLPFVSQGSSSLWTFLIGIGILQSILLHHRKLAFQSG
jgi:rod shape determining protein RodA